MLRTLIVGLGHAGWRLHLPVLARIRQPVRASDLPVVAVDPRGAPPGEAPAEVSVVPSLARARAVLDPDRTVVHVCTPPSARADLLAELAGLGFRNVLVEKPMATDEASLDRMVALARAHDLRLMVVAHWLDSALTQRLRDALAAGDFGPLRSISVAQRKPRFSKTFGTDGHPTAFDVELPHSVGVALDLVGDAEVVDASWSDIRAGEEVVPRMGTARLVLEHRGGVRTEIFSDLTSPLRERRISLHFESGTVVGHYPGSRDDDYAHLRSSRLAGPEVRDVFPDDSLYRFLHRAYRRFACPDEDLAPDLALNVRVTTLLCQAKRRCSSYVPVLSVVPGPAWPAVPVGEVVDNG